MLARASGNVISTQLRTHTSPSREAGMGGERVAVNARQIGGGGVPAGSSTQQHTMDQEPNANASAADQAQGLIATLFDFSFSSFVTTKFIKFIYGLAMLIAGLA